MPTRQDAAIVLCGGGDPWAEFARALGMLAGQPYTVFAGNDMIGAYGGTLPHACTLHPDKLHMWTGQRITQGLPAAEHTWAHRPFTGVSDFTRDWSGSTGLFCVKVARELGFVHILLCGVHMDPDSNHFVRKARWDACSGFLRGWELRKDSIAPYVRSFGGWTKEQFGEPTLEWLRDDIEDKHPEPAPPTQGLKA